MSSTKKTFCPEKLNIVLSTIPSIYFSPESNKGKSTTDMIFNASVEKLFKKYSNRYNQLINKNNNGDNGNGQTRDDQNNLYFKVLRYHIFGSYDIAYITLAESDKFAQTIFAPFNNIQGMYESSYQIMSGITYPINADFNLSKCFRNLIDRTSKNSSNVKSNNGKSGIDEASVFVTGKYKFCMITNLKINPWHLIWGNMDHFEKIEHKIKEIIYRCFIKEDCNSADSIEDKSINQFILTRSFSWNDLILTSFNNDTNKLLNLVLRLRRLKLKDLYDESTLNTIIDTYNNLNNNLIEITNEAIKNSHIFVETQSYFGIEYDYFKNGKIQNDDSLLTQIEFKSKVGHEEMFEKIIEDSEFKGIFEEGSLRFIFGSTDLMLVEKGATLENNQKVSRKFRENGFGGHVKKIKTKVYKKLENNTNNDNDSKNQAFQSFYENLKVFIIRSKDLDDIDKMLKKLKVPYHLRQKTIKLFSNFNNGVLDPVLTLSFQDFFYFIKQFKYIILHELQNEKKVDNIEKRLNEYLISFDKAFYSRMLNTYLFEEMSDIDIDYQSSIQKYLSIYNSIAIVEAKTMFPEEKYFAKIVNANLKNTVGSLISINFNIHHLTAPEFFIISLHKEILNPYVNAKQSTIKSLFDNIKETLSADALKKLNLYSINDNKNKSLIAYVLIDILRVFVTFGGDFKLYYYFSWYFNLQNASLYKKNGFVGEEHFQFEIKRMLLVAFVLGVDINEHFWLPTIELSDYWQNQFIPLKEVISNTSPFKLEEDLGDFIYQIHLKFNERSCVIKNCMPFEKKSSSNAQLVDFNRSFDCLKKLLALELNSEDLNSEYIKSKKSINDNNMVDISLIYKYFSLTYLKEIYKKNTNNGKKNGIDLLKRNLEDGSSLNSFLEHYSNSSKFNSFYLLDNQGGIFFNRIDSLQGYYKLRDDFYKILMDLNLIIKNKLFKEALDNYNSNKTNNNE